MLGAVIGDVIGSVYEWNNVKSEDFPLFSHNTHFTDDTAMTVATAVKLINDKKGLCDNSSLSYAMQYKAYYKRYPHAGYAGMFKNWANNSELYVQHSYGNGAAMRISPIGFACESIKEIEKQTKASCHYTHNHPEAEQCAYAVALAIFLARKGSDKSEIKTQIEHQTNIKLNFTIDEIRPTYSFSSRSINSVPQAIEAFMEGSDYESTIRKAISTGGDSDTIACIAGGIAEAYYKTIPEDIVQKAYRYIDGTIKNVIKEFYECYNINK